MWLLTSLLGGYLLLQGGRVSAQLSVADLTLVGPSLTNEYVNWFYTYNKAMDFPSAVQFCKNFGFQIATILGPQDQVLITNYANLASKANEFQVWWLGASKSPAEGIWRWTSTGTLVPLPGGNAIEYWLSGEPYTNPGINCMAVNLIGPVKEKWTQYYCNEIGFIRPLCENRVPLCLGVGDAAASSSSQVADLTLVGNTLVTERAKWFYSKNIQMNWTSAISFCEGRGLRLASIENKWDQSVITTWASDATRANDWGFWWLAGTDAAQEGVWRWRDTDVLIPLPGQTSVDQYWIAGEPTINPSVNCLHVNLGWYKGRWTQHFCSTSIMRPLCMSRLTTCYARPTTATPLPPPTTVPVQTTTSTPSCNCGLFKTPSNNPLIVGGSPAVLGEFPWRCLLYTYSRSFFCGCTIISANWVLTAAHCTNPLSVYDILFIDVGDLDTSTNTEASNVIVRADRVIQHSGFSVSPYIVNDIALVHLQTPITFSSMVQPACVPFPYRGQTLVGSKVTLSGWGLQTPGGIMSSKLMKADFNVVDLNECKNYYGPNSVTSNNLCTVVPTKSACNGDSGSGLDYVGVNGRVYSVGVVSFGSVNCTVGLPNAFTKVDQYLDWIVANSGGEQFCQP